MKKRKLQTYLTIQGLLYDDPDFFEVLALPESLDRDILVFHLMQYCGLLELSFPDGDLMKRAVAMWSASRLPDWRRMINALYSEYNPIENYDKQSTITNQGGHSVSTGTVKNYIEKVDDDTIRTPNLTNTRTPNITHTDGGTETVDHSNTAYDVGLSVTARDTTTFTGRTKTETGMETNTETGTDTTNRDISTASREGVDGVETGTNNNTMTERTHGNIGVKTTQSMIIEEIGLRYEYNIYEIIAKEFKEKFCNLMYIL